MDGRAELRDDGEQRGRRFVLCAPSRSPEATADGRATVVHSVDLATDGPATPTVRTQGMRGVVLVRGGGARTTLRARRSGPEQRGQLADVADRRQPLDRVDQLVGALVADHRRGVAAELRTDFVAGQRP